MSQDNKSKLSELPSLTSRPLSIDAAAMRAECERMLAEMPEPQTLSVGDVRDMMLAAIPDALECLQRNLHCGQVEVQIQAASILLNYGTAIVATESDSGFLDDVIDD